MVSQSNQVSRDHIELLIQTITEQRNFAMDRQADITAHSRMLERKVKSMEQEIISLKEQIKVSQ